jgi:hypothetical protein
MPPPCHSCAAQHLLVILFILLDSSHRNSVQISGTRLGDSSTALASGILILINLLDNAELLERLDNLAVNGAGGIDVVVGPRATVLGASVDLAETANTDGFAQVDVSGDGGGADVEPIGGLRGQLVAVRGLDGINPTCEWMLVQPSLDMISCVQRCRLQPPCRRSSNMPVQLVVLSYQPHSLFGAFWDGIY